MHFTDAADLLDFLAERTWDVLTDAHDLQISISEESITDINLLEIRRCNLKNVSVIKFPKLAEAKIGADWDLWIGTDSVGWFRYLIQAKKLYLKSGNYQRLRHHHFDEHKNKTWQIDQLHKFALQAGAIPAYCFYNGGHALAHCISKIYGCSISSYQAVRRQHDSHRHGSKTFAALHPRSHSFPWSALVQQHHEWIKLFSSRRQHPLIEKQINDQPVNPKIFPRVPDSIRRVVSFSAQLDVDYITKEPLQHEQRTGEPTNTLLLDLFEEYQESNLEPKMFEHPALSPKRIGIIELEYRSPGRREPSRR